MYFKHFLITCFIFIIVECQINLKNYFGNCRKNDINFNQCVEKGINDLRPLLKYGIPELRIEPIEPIFIKKHMKTYLFPYMNVTGIINNVIEAGWSQADYTNVKVDLRQQSLQFRQHFPKKFVSGMYIMYATVFGNKIYREGNFNFSMYDYEQIFTVTRRKLTNNWNSNPPFVVDCNVARFTKMEIYINNFFNGNEKLEKLLQTVINRAFNTRFELLYSYLHEVVNAALSNFINKNFQYFDFEKVFPN